MLTREDYAQIQRDLAEAHRYQREYSGVVQSQMSCILPILGKLADALGESAGLTEVARKAFKEAARGPNR